MIDYKQFKQKASKMNYYQLHNLEQCHIFMNLLAQELSLKVNFGTALLRTINCLDNYSLIGQDANKLFEIVNHNHNHCMDRAFSAQIFSMEDKYNNAYLDLFLNEVGVIYTNQKVKIHPLFVLCNRYNKIYNYLIMQTCFKNHMGNHVRLFKKHYAKSNSAMVSQFLHNLSVNHDLPEALKVASKYSRGFMKHNLKKLSKYLNKDQFDKYQYKLQQIIKHCHNPLLKSFFKELKDTVHVNDLTKQSVFRTLNQQMESYTNLKQARQLYTRQVQKL